VTAPGHVTRSLGGRSDRLKWARWGGNSARSGARSASLPKVLGELEAVVVEVRPWDVHGVGYVDVTVVYPDRMLETARLGPESIPDHLQPGEHVIVNKAVNMIVGIRRTS
jgi:hypothetical protein